MRVESLANVIDYIYEDTSSFILVVDQFTKTQLLRQLNRLYLPKIVLYNDFVNTLYNEVDSELLPLLFEELGNFELAKNVFEALKVYEVCSDESSELVQSYYLKYLNSYIFKPEPELKKVYTLNCQIDGCEEILVEEKSNDSVEIRAAKTEILEVEYIANQIATLLDSGVHYDEIDVCINPRYEDILYYVFKMYNISVVRNYKTKLISNRQVQNYLNNFDLDMLELVPEEILNKIISILNKYGTNNQEFLRAVIEDSYVYASDSFEGLRIKDYKEINTDNHVFLIGICQLEFIKTHIDDRYLTDATYKLLGYPTSHELNRREKDILIDKIKRSKNILCTYTSSLNGEPIKANAIFDNIKCIENEMLNFQDELRFGENFDQFYLKQQLYYREKFLTIDESLLYLNGNISLYDEYDNRFYNTENYEVPNDIRLSASSIQNFYECEYKFYLQNILRLRVYKATNQINIGNYIHKVLEVFYDPNNNYTYRNLTKIFKILNDEFNYIDNNGSKSSENKRQFYLDKINLFIRDLIKIMDIQQKRMKFDVIDVEDEYFDDLAFDLKDGMTLVGKIDKVLRDKNNNFIVVDYKTGYSELKFNHLDAGLDLQNLIYFVLLKQKHKEVNFAGTYRQKVAPKYLSEIQEFDKLFNLNGFTQHSVNTINSIGEEYLANAKLTKSGIAKVSRTMDIETFEENIKLTKKKIRHVARKVKAGEFNLNPKDLDNVDSCKYCPFEGVCYKQKRDFERI